MFGQIIIKGMDQVFVQEFLKFLHISRLTFLIFPFSQAFIALKYCSVYKQASYLYLIVLKDSQSNDRI